jgi:hypothetical protein
MISIVEAILKTNTRQNELIRIEAEPPEKKFIELLKRQAPDPFTPNALFMTTTLVFGDDTYRLFGRIANKELLNTYEWMFRPNRVVEAVGAGINVQERCLKFFRPGGYNRIATSQWVHNCQVLEDRYGGDIRNFFKENDDDALQIIDSLVVRPRARTKEKTGLRRAGPKIARLYMQWVGQYGLYDLRNIDKFGVPVDFQLGRVAIQGGGIEIDTPANADLITRRTLLPLISDICQEKGLSPQMVSERMWMVGNRLCNKKRHTDCPIEDMCTRMISRKPYDKDGLFDPTDMGRYD